MTADIRTAAQREADANIGGFIAQTWFVDGAEWGASRVTPTREQIEKVLTDHEIGDGGTPHSWRCEYPDRYPGYCTCVKDIASDILDLMEKPKEGY